MLEDASSLGPGLAAAKALASGAAKGASQGGHGCRAFLPYG